MLSEKDLGIKNLGFGGYSFLKGKVVFELVYHPNTGVAKLVPRRITDMYRGWGGDYSFAHDGMKTPMDAWICISDPRFYRSKRQALLQLKAKIAEMEEVSTLAKKKAELGKVVLKALKKKAA